MRSPVFQWADPLTLELILPSPLDETSLVQMAAIHRQVLAAMQGALGLFVTDAVLAWNRLSLRCRIHPVMRPWLERQVQACVDAAPEGGHVAEATEVTLPVCYHPDVAPDLQAFCAARNLTIPEFVALHSGRVYRVGAIGFLPGFAYLGFTHSRLACSRLATPRIRVPGGAVALAGQQTAVYPCESPGGWHLIGRTARPLFDSSGRPVMTQVGQRVRFEPISIDAWRASGGTDD
jgi:KipI family sensor histidine kinase inhibitor